MLATPMTMLDNVRKVRPLPLLILSSYDLILLCLCVLPVCKWTGRCTRTSHPPSQRRDPVIWGNLCELSSHSNGLNGPFFPVCSQSVPDLVSCSALVLKQCWNRAVAVRGNLSEPWTAQQGRQKKKTKEARLPCEQTLQPETQSSAQWDIQAHFFSSNRPCCEGYSSVAYQRPVGRKSCKAFLCSVHKQNVQVGRERIVVFFKVKYRPNIIRCSVERW